MQTRDRLHALIDDLPEGELPAVERFLVERGAADNEPLTPDDEAAIEEGMDAIARGDVMTQSIVRRSLSL